MVLLTRTIYYRCSASYYSRVTKMEIDASPELAGTPADLCAHATPETPPSSNREPLLPEHIAYLEARAVTADAAIAAGLRSVTAEEAAKVLGFPRVSSGGLMIPYPPPLNLHRLRMDQGRGAENFSLPQAFAFLSTQPAQASPIPHRCCTSSKGRSRRWRSRWG